MRRLFRLLSLVCLALLLLLLSALAAQAAPQPERRVALIIGNGAYKDAPLKNPVNDARDMNAALKKLGFETTLLTDASMQQMETAVREFGLKLRQGGMGLFYYAGHGVQVGGNNYLVPVKAVIQSESDVKYGCLDAGLVLGKMEDAGNGLNLIILDACRNNPFARSFRSTEQGLAKMDAPTGSLIAYATSPGKTAADGEGKNGLYTQHLLKNITTPGLSVEELFKRVRQGVAGDSAKKQVPWEASSLIGQFSFAGGEQTVSLGPAAAFLAHAPPQALKLPEPPQAGVSFDDLRTKAEEQQRAEEAAKKKWAAWQADMKKAVAEADKLSKNPKLGDGAKAQAWQRVAQAYAAENPYAGAADQALRQKVKAEAAYWDTQAQLMALAPAPKQAPPAVAPAAPAGAPGKTWRDPVTGMEFVWVPGGKFEMGCGQWTDSCSNDEAPIHWVRLDGFWLGKHEVTQGQWKTVMGSNPSRFQKGDRYPVETVSWNDTKSFINRMHTMGAERFRLPTEAEWEYAARSGGKSEKFAGGRDIEQLAWYGGNSGRSTHEVGAKTPNGLGLFDMSGNVSEWCEDVYTFEGYSSHVPDNPVSTSGGLQKVNRGGSWDDANFNVRSGRRGHDQPKDHYGSLGLRLVRIP